MTDTDLLIIGMVILGCVVLWLCHERDALRRELMDLRTRHYCLWHAHHRLLGDWEATDVFARNHTHGDTPATGPQKWDL